MSAATADDREDDENPLPDDGDEFVDGEEVLSVAIEGDEDELELSVTEE